MPRTRVTVIVPVFNPGDFIEALITSLHSQTLPQSEFEVVFSDDGSTDATPARLDELAEAHDNVRVIHAPNSGWPGRPRNLGLDIARGDYVFFVDQDDWLGDEALERMCGFAEQNRSDVLLGRYAGHHRRVAKAPFRQTRGQVSLADTPLFDSLTPHKMFRRAFLLEHQLRFPEGKRRLEDHVFVAQAYFLAERISVLADYHCYFHVSREDAGNAGFQRVEPVSYYEYVREVVDIVLANTEPGSLRDRCLRRSLRTEILGRLGSRSFLRQSTAYRAALFTEARRLLVASMPTSVDAGLAPPQRVRATLLREDRRGDYERWVEQDLNAVARSTLLDLRCEGGVLILDFEAMLADTASGQAWRYDVEGDETYLPPPPGAAGPFPHDAANCTKQLAASGADLVVRRREDSQEWVAPTESSATIANDGTHASAALRCTARIDVSTLSGGEPLPFGIWDLFVVVRQAGWTKQARLGATRTDRATEHAERYSVPGRVVRPYWTQGHHNLALEIHRPGAVPVASKRSLRRAFRRLAGHRVPRMVIRRLAGHRVPRAVIRRLAGHRVPRAVIRRLLGERYAEAEVDSTRRRGVG